jgi:hypothetical protein
MDQGLSARSHVVSLQARFWYVCYVFVEMLVSLADCIFKVIPITDSWSAINDQKMGLLFQVPIWRDSVT